jgi:creatinine amidohydrolase
MEVEWSRLKAHELRDLAKRDGIVLVPIGATEQHGPHLPVMVDYRLATEVCHRAARLVVKTDPIAVTPTLPFGMSEHHMPLGGTITLDFPTMLSTFRCVVRSLTQHGFKRIFILNGHGGNTTPLDVIVTELTIEFKIPLAYATYWGIGEKRIAALLDRQKALLHACEAETSMIMALAPELVDSDSLSQMHGPYIPGGSSIAGVNPAAVRWRYIPTRSPNGVIGDAATASAEKGEKLLDAIAEELAITLKNKDFWSAPI